MALAYDMTSDGFAIYRGPLKLAVVGCMTPGAPVTRQKPEGSGAIRDQQGNVIEFPTLVPLPRKHWGIHFTSPALNLEELEAIVAGMPKGDDPTAHSLPRVGA